MVQTRSTTAVVSTPSVDPGPSHHTSTDSQAGGTSAQEESHYDEPPSQVTTIIAPEATDNEDDTEGGKAKDFGLWRNGTGISPAHLRSLFNGIGVEEGGFDHPQVEEPEWTPEDFDRFDDANGVCLRETMEGVETAKKSEVSVCGSHSGFQLTVTGDARAGLEDSPMEESDKLQSQEPSLAGPSPHGSFGENPQSGTMSIIKPESDVAMEDAENASRAVSEEMGDDTANLAASQDAMEADESVANKDESHEPAHDDIPIQAGVEPLETSSTAYNLTSLGHCIVTPIDGQSSTAGIPSSIQDGRKGPERSYMVISNRELSELAPDSKTDFDVKGKRPRKGTPAKYTRRFF